MSGDDVANFLSIVEPWEAGTYVNVHAFALDDKAKLIPKASRAARDLYEASSFARWADSMGWEVYVCMSSQRQTGTGKIDKRGRTTYRALRGEVNAVKVKSIYLDVDAGIKPDGTPAPYKSTQDVISAVQGFCATLGLPLPSMVVYSGGGGAHVHWVLDRPVDPPVWKDVAQRLAEACRQHGLKADHNVTVDIARILRLPGTYNRKYNKQPRIVTLEVTGSLVPLEIFQEKLAVFEAPALPQNSGGSGQGGTRTTQPDLTNFPSGLPPVDISKFLAGVTPDLYTLEEVAEGCPFIKETLRTGGKGQREPQWFIAAHVAIFTAGGIDDYHRLSRGHTGYDIAETVAKYQRILQNKVSTDQGWPRCATIENAGTTQCVTCPNKILNKSPLSFAAKTTSAPGVTQASNLLTNFPQAPSPQGVANGKSGDKPHLLKVVAMQGYMHDPVSGYVRVPETDPVTGNTIDVMLWRYPVWNLDYKRVTNGGYAIHFDTEFDHDNWTHVIVPTEALANVDSMRRCLVGKHGLGVHNAEQKRLLNYMTDFMSQMRALKLNSSRQEMMGWSDGPNGLPTGFIFGPTRYNCNGNTPFSQTEQVVRDYYFPTGSPEPYQVAIRMLNAERRPEMDILAATAYASPLMRFTGQSGVVISAYSSGSAHHKSSALKVGQSTWGHFKAINQLTDTSNAVLEMIGKTKVMPAYYDEMKSSTDIEKFAGLVYTFAGGRGKARLTRNAEIKDVGVWETMLIGASNDSLMNFMAAHDKTTEAGINRIFEFPVSAPDPRYGQISMGDAGKILKALETNYGHQGAIYAEHLGKSVEWLPGRVTEAMNVFENDLKATGDERFWVAAAVALLIGAQMANDLNLARFDVACMGDFIAKTFVNMRKSRAFGNLDASKDVNILGVLQQYLNTHRRSILVTDTMNVPAGRRRLGGHIVKVLNFDEVRTGQQMAIHYAENDAKLRVSRKHYSDWLGRLGLAPNVHVPNLMELYGGKIVNTRIGPGTDFSTAIEKLIELDLNHPDLRNLFDG